MFFINKYNNDPSLRRDYFEQVTQLSIQDLRLRYQHEGSPFIAEIFEEIFSLENDREWFETHQEFLQKCVDIGLTTAVPIPVYQKMFSVIAKQGLLIFEHLFLEQLLKNAVEDHDLDLTLLILAQHKIGSTFLNDMLNLACTQKIWTLVDPLLAAGADINARFTDGETLLMRAAEQEDEELVAFLLSKKARTEIEDDDGYRAIHHALFAKENTAVLEQLFSVPNQIKITKVWNIKCDGQDKHTFLQHVYRSGYKNVVERVLHLAKKEGKLNQLEELDDLLCDAMIRNDVAFVKKIISIGVCQQTKYKQNIAMSEYVGALASGKQEISCLLKREITDPDYFAMVEEALWRHMVAGLLKISGKSGIFTRTSKSAIMQLQGFRSEKVFEVITPWMQEFFLAKSHYFSKQEKDYLFFLIKICSVFHTSFEIFRLVQNVPDILFSSGWYKHCIHINIHRFRNDDYMIVCNRGAGSNVRQDTFFAFMIDKSKITPKILEDLREFNVDFDFDAGREFLYETLPRILSPYPNQAPVRNWFCRLFEKIGNALQTTGNCAFAASTASLRALFFTKMLIKNPSRNLQMQRVIELTKNLQTFFKLKISKEFLKRCKAVAHLIKPDNKLIQEVKDKTNHILSKPRGQKLLEDFPDLVPIT